VSIDVLAGQVIGLVGPSGSGKSTITKLIQRLYVPEGGRVTVDGVDLAMVDPAWLRRQVGVVLMLRQAQHEDCSNSGSLNGPHPELVEG
jgi:subfamily B ATP-binding cassette protein HlyB/CyaB